MSSTKPYLLLLNQAVQIQLEGRSEPICGMVTNCLADEYVIRFPQLTQIPEGLAPRLRVTLRCADAAGLHTGITEIVELFQPPRPGVVIKSPRQFELIQNRRFFRVEVDFPCSVQHIGESGMPMARDMDDRAKILDLSAGGARVTTTCHAVVGEKVLVDFIPKLEMASASAPAGPKTLTPKPLRPIAITPAGGTPQTCPVVSPNLRLTAKVIRVSELACDGPGTFQMGIEFEGLNNRTQDRLVTLIFDVQRSQCHRR